MPRLMSLRSSWYLLLNSSIFTSHLSLAELDTSRAHPDFTVSDIVGSRACDPCCQFVSEGTRLWQRLRNSDSLDAFDVDLHGVRHAQVRVFEHCMPRFSL